VAFAEVVATGVQTSASVLRSTLNPVSFDDVSVQFTFTTEDVVATLETPVGVISSEYVSVAAMRESLAPLVLDVRTAPTSSNVPEFLVIDKPLNVVVTSSAGVVAESE
jgi:hypothetical protein